MGTVFGDRGLDRGAPSGVETYSLLYWVMNMATDTSLEIKELLRIHNISTGMSASINAKDRWEKG